MAKTLLIVWHSRTNAAKQMAMAAAQGANAIAQQLGAGDDFILQNMYAAEVTAKHLLAADAYLFAAPENLASLSGAMKEFFDSNYYQVLEQLNGRPYAAIITAGSDGENAKRQLERICLGWRLEKIAETIIVPMHAQTAATIWAPKTVPPNWLAQAKELGGTLAALIL